MLESESKHLSAGYLAACEHNIAEDRIDKRRSARFEIDTSLIGTFLVRASWSTFHPFFLGARHVGISLRWLEDL